jgi:hypothetical protein
VAQTRTFKGRHFAAEVIVWALRWYLMFPISYRDLELMLADRGMAADHTTLFRRVGGDVASPAPHRPGRADFPHPVLQERVSLTVA